MISSTAPFDGAHKWIFLLVLLERIMAIIPVIVDVLPVPGGP